MKKPRTTKKLGRFTVNARNKGDGRRLLDLLPRASVALVMFDPQYRRLLEKMDYGNDDSKRTKLPQMTPEVIGEFLEGMAHVVRPSGHLMCWMDKLELLNYTHEVAEFELVDMITWEKVRWGNGYRSRRKSEFLVIYQRVPKRARGVWTDHSIPDVWTPERESEQMELLGNRRTYPSSPHPHAKPEGLTRRLIEATTRPGDLVVDPSAGGYSVLRAAQAAGREFLGCDLLG